MIKGMTLNNRGNRLFMVLGLLLGAAAAALALIYLSTAKDGSSGSGGAAGDVPVVVATVDVPSGTRLTAEMIALKKVTDADVLTGAFSTTEGVVNQVTTVDLVTGEQIIAAKVTGSDAALAEFGPNPPLSLLLEPGTRGLSVKVSSLIGAGGNIRPGDFVDVILVVEVKSASNSGDPAAQGTTDQLALTILQNVKVLAIDTERTPADPSGATDPSKSKGENNEATTVTLGVKPLQGEVLAMADVCAENHGGRLALALRPLGEKTKIDSRAEATAATASVCSEILGIRDGLGQ